MNQIVILAGGLATRLEPISRETPKSLIAISGVPFIKRQIENLTNLGINNFHFCLGNQAMKIEQYLSRSEFAGLSISTSRDCKMGRGTAGALIDAREYIQDEFLLTYGDSYLPVNLERLEESWSEFHGLLKLAVKNVQGSRHHPNVQIGDRGTFSYGIATSNPSYIDYGLMRLNKGVIDFIQDMSIENLTTVIEKLSLSGDATCAITEDPLFEIGSFEGIIELEEYFRSQNELC